MELDSSHLLAAVLEEYKTLRAEVIAAIDRQYSLTNWGVSAVALLAGALVGAWDKMRQHPNVVVAAIVIVLPAMVTSYAIAWSNLSVKIRAIGAYIHHMEEKVNSCFTEKLFRQTFSLSIGPVNKFSYGLGWEHRL